MPLDRTEALVTETLFLREDLVDRTIERERVEASYYRAIRRLHDDGLPLRSIAREVRLSHQRVHQIVSNPTRTLERQRRRALPFRRGTPWSFSDRTSDAIERAEDEARQRHHPTVDLQHMLLGALLLADTQLARALAELGIDRATIRPILAAPPTGGGGTPAKRRLPIAARARVATELARREASW